MERDIGNMDFLQPCESLDKMYKNKEEITMNLTIEHHQD